MKDLIFKLLRVVTYPIVSFIPLDSWNYWFGRIHDIKLYGKVKPAAVVSTSGSANINIIIDLIKQVQALDGNIAECGVFRGATLTSMAFYIKKQQIKKQLFGFDSFEGFAKSDLVSDLQFHDSADIKNEAVLFQNNSIALVENKLKLGKVADKATLVKGYFENTLKNYSTEKFCFAHLDCDLYEPYKICLEFFYPRMAKGGIILFDEYNDPVYTKCNLAVDEFLKDKPEKLESMVRDNQQKYFFRKL